MASLKAKQRAALMVVLMGQSKACAMEYEMEEQTGSLSARHWAYSRAWQREHLRVSRKAEHSGSKKDQSRAMLMVPMMGHSMVLLRGCSRGHDLARVMGCLKGDQLETQRARRKAHQRARRRVHRRVHLKAPQMAVQKVVLRV